jgi:hypothetical protein
MASYFGVDFETMTRQFERDLLEKEMRERLFSFSFRVDDLRGQIASLRAGEGGADWVYRLTRPLVESGRGCSFLVVRQLANMVKTRNHILTIEREATEEEAKRREASEGRPMQRPILIMESLGAIAGLEALYPEHDLRQLLVLDLDEPLKVFETETVDQMTFERLRHWSKWIGSVDATLETAVQAVDYGRRLLVPSNLEQFDALLNTEGSNELRRFLKTLNAPAA